MKKYLYIIITIALLVASALVVNKCGMPVDAFKNAFSKYLPKQSTFDREVKTIHDSIVIYKTRVDTFEKRIYIDRIIEKHLEADRANHSYNATPDSGATKEVIRHELSEADTSNIICDSMLANLDAIIAQQDSINFDQEKIITLKNDEITGYRKDNKKVKRKSALQVILFILIESATIFLLH